MEINKYNLVTQNLGTSLYLSLSCPSFCGLKPVLHHLSLLISGYFYFFQKFGKMYTDVMCI